MKEVKVSITNWNTAQVVCGLRVAELDVVKGSAFGIVVQDNEAKVIVNDDLVLSYRLQGVINGQPVFTITQGGANYLNRSHDELVSRINFQAKAAI